MERNAHGNAATIAALSAICLVLLARRRRGLASSHSCVSTPASGADTLVLSLGSTCLTANVLSIWGARRFAVPFDWLFTAPLVVAHVVESAGSALLDPLQLFKVEQGGVKIGKVGHTRYTPMLLDSMRRCSSRRVNKQGVLFNHHDPTTSDVDRAYFTRALRRLRAALASSKPKLCILTSHERRLAVSDDELDALLATLAEHSTPSAPLELVAIRLLAPRSAADADVPPTHPPAPRLCCRRTRTQQHAVLRCMELSCRGGLTSSGLALSDAADMLDLARACFGSEACLDSRGRLQGTGISFAADPSVGLETSDLDHVKPCGKMSTGWGSSSGALPKCRRKGAP